MAHENGASDESGGHLAHHFDTPRQQFEAGKLGMWLFLATEVLLFGGLFCGYAVYRANHPEIFVYAHQFLDSTLGGINTLVLIASSFTMAWAVRAAQTGDQKKLKLCLGLTLLGACGFLGIKFVEYEHKWKHGLLPGKWYESQSSSDSPADAGEAMADLSAVATPAGAAEEQTTPTSTEGEAATPETGRSRIPVPPAGPPGLRSEESAAEDHTAHEPENVHVFFSIYFVMTGLHGFHVIAGMIVIGWLLRRAMCGEFGPDYFTPVDLVGLYWHIVDIIWIFLFPLLYLIH